MKNKNQKIVKANKLIEARHDFMNVTEYKLIYVAISQIDKFTDLAEPIKFEVKEFCALMDIKKSGAYSYIKSACDKLMERKVHFEKDDGKWEKVQWFSKIEYEKGIIKLWVNVHLEEYLFYCKKNKAFTKYLLKIILRFNSFYAIRTYELLKQYQKIGIRKFSIEEFKFLLGINTSINATKYKQYKHLKARIILPLLEELNTHSDIIVDFREVKTSQQVTELVFEIISNAKFNAYINEDYITSYRKLPKVKISYLLKKYFHGKTGYDIPAMLLLSYHRIVLEALLAKVDRGSFDNVLIESPSGFVTWHLNDLKGNYDEEQLKKIKDK
jgi:plasmid replication initiation protein